VLFCLSLVPMCLFPLQHLKSTGIEVLDQAYEVVPNFTSLNFGRPQDWAGSMDSETNSAVRTGRRSDHSFRRCTIPNCTVKVPYPQFIIAGAQKCGTTALFQFLKQHPSIQPSVARELHFFDRDYPSSDVLKEMWLRNRNLPLDIPDSDFRCAVKQAYGENFVISPNAPAGTIFFEKTPSYLFLARVPELIISTCSWKPKIIVLLRNPVDRAFSHFRMELSPNSTQGRSFEDLIDDEIAKLRLFGLSNAPLRTADYTQDDPGFQIPHPAKKASEEKHWSRIFNGNYLQRGMYMIQLNRWMRLFPLGESLIVLNYDRFKYEPTKIFSELLDFVGVPPFIPAKGFATKHNARGPSQYPMSNATRKYLSAFFRPHNNMLADVLGEEWRGVWD
jgi:hypothetical protein